LWNDSQLYHSHEVKFLIFHHENRRSSSPGHGNHFAEQNLPHELQMLCQEKGYMALNKKWSNVSSHSAHHIEQEDSISFITFLPADREILRWFPSHQQKEGIADLCNTAKILWWGIKLQCQIFSERKFFMCHFICPFASFSPPNHDFEKRII
jgi:hypothetical protein